MRLVLALVLLVPIGAAQAAESLSAVITMAKYQAYRSSRVDWPQVEAQAAIVEKTEGEDAAIRYVVRALGDPHTRYQPAGASLPSSKSSVSGSIEAEVVPPIAVALPKVRGIPVLQINSWSGAERAAATASVRDGLVAGFERENCGLVLDFSENQGGNMWPMLVGLAPLLTEGRLGAFRSAQGVDTPIENRGGRIYMGGQPHELNQAVSQSPKHLPKWIALVIGKKTASSGEITSLMFHGQPNVRYFGTESAGYSTANRASQLPNGGLLVLTTSATLGRNGNEYVQKVAPDVQTQNPIQDAAAWIKAQCGGRPKLVAPQKAPD